MGPEMIARLVDVGMTKYTEPILTIYMYIYIYM